MARKEKPQETLLFWKRRYEKAQPYEDAHIASQNRLVPVEYLQWLGLAEYVAISGLSRSGISYGFHLHPGARALVEAEQRHLKRRAKQLVEKLDFWQPTSIRRGFAGGGFDGAQSLPKRMAMAAGVGGADLIPDQAELFLGFTSTQKAGLGPTRIANLETLGYSDGGPGGYFRHGTAMHVSHLFEDLEGWYINFSHDQRVSTAFRPTITVPSGTLTVAQGPDDVATDRQNRSDYVRFRAIGHSASIQTTSRLLEDTTGTDGTLYAKGTAIPHRADFNTLDNPFFWTARPEVDSQSDQPAAGLHFVVFNPTSDDFHRNRLAMDGVLPDGTKLPFDPKDRGQGFNSVLTTTHRQNYLVPPRLHRSFPLAEYLS